MLEALPENHIVLRIQPCYLGDLTIQIICHFIINFVFTFVGDIFVLFLQFNPNQQNIAQKCLRNQDIWALQMFPLPLAGITVRHDTVLILQEDQWPRAILCLLTSEIPWPSSTARGSYILFQMQDANTKVQM